MYNKLIRNVTEKSQQSICGLAIFGNVLEKQSYSDYLSVN